MGRTYRFSHPTSYPSIKNVVDMSLILMPSPKAKSEFNGSKNKNFYHLGIWLAV